MWLRSGDCFKAPFMNSARRLSNRHGNAPLCPGWLIASAPHFMRNESPGSP
jgi:hypothetical protein